VGTLFVFARFGTLIHPYIVTSNNMRVIPTELYVLGALVVLINIGSAIWFGGLFAIINTISGVTLAVVLGWSALGAPGVERLGAYLHD